MVYTKFNAEYVTAARVPAFSGLGAVGGIDGRAAAGQLGQRAPDATSPVTGLRQPAINPTMHNDLTQLLTSVGWDNMRQPNCRILSSQHHIANNPSWWWPPRDPIRPADQSLPGSCHTLC